MPEMIGPKRAASAEHAQPLKRAGSMPAAQIAPTSSVGIALGEIAITHGGTYQRKGKYDDSEGDSPSDPSDDSSSDDDSSEINSSEGENNRTRKKKSKKRRTQKHRRRGSPRASIKPIPPKEYNGSVDMRAYYRFVREGEAYLRDGKVRDERQIRILAHYLDGKAYDFYMQKVAPDDPKNWSLHKFFTELYNYCFPIDYKQRIILISNPGLFGNPGCC